MAGLRVPKDVGIGVSTEEEAREYWDTMPEADAMLARMRIPTEPTPPEVNEAPVITPGSLSSMGHDDFSRLHEQCVGWAGYYSEQLARLKGYALQCDNEMKYIEARTKEQAVKLAKVGGEKSPSAEKLKIMVGTEPRYKELRREHQKFTQALLQAQAVYDRMEAQRALVSRHIELRKLGFNGQRENSNLNERGRERHPRYHGGR